MNESVVSLPGDSVETSRKNWFLYDELPASAGGFSKLFLDYVNQFQRVQGFYETDFHLPGQIRQCAERTCQRFRFRTELVEILLDQNREFGSSERAIENIHKLGQGNSVAVVTGQQVGMLTGPLYTIYKTISAIKLADNLNLTFPEFHFVPVFWLENEDHDFDEANKVGLLDAEHAPVNVEYLVNGKPLDKNIGAVGQIVFDNYIQTFLDQLQKSLSPSEFKKPLVEMLQEMYQPGVTFTKAFALLMNRLFGNAGLVLVSSNDKRIKKLLAPLFKKEIGEYPVLSQRIIEKSAELELRYHTQIKPKALNLFYFHKGGRYLIEPREKDFSLKGTRQYFQKDELLHIADETPELFSANVVLRPICQDTVLPTVIYVGGPSEIAYFAQLKPVYGYFDLPMPIIYPRSSATILEAKHEKILEKYELDLLDFFGNPQKVNQKVIDLVSEVKIDEIFNEAGKRIDDLINEMKFGLNYVDPTLLGALETTRSKTHVNFQLLKEKTVEAQKRRHEVALRQVGRVANSIFPNGNFQERELNIVYFLNKHGLDFVQRLYNELQIDTFKHQVIRLS